MAHGDDIATDPGGLSVVSDLADTVSHGQRHAAAARLDSCLDIDLYRVGL